MRTKWIIRKILLVEFVFCLAGAVQACPPPPCPPCWGPWPACNVFCNNQQNTTCCNNSCCVNDCCYGSCFNNATKYCCGPGVLCNNGDGCCDSKACFDDETKHCCNHGTGKTCNNSQSCCKGTQGEACCNDPNETCCDGKCCPKETGCCWMDTEDPACRLDENCGCDPVWATCESKKQINHKSSVYIAEPGGPGCIIDLGEVLCNEWRNCMATGYHITEVCATFDPRFPEGYCTVAFWPYCQNCEGVGIWHPVNKRSTICNLD